MKLYKPLLRLIHAFWMIIKICEDDGIAAIQWRCRADPAIDVWMKEHAGELGAIAHQWFEVMRKCGDEVRELLHDGCPVACLGDAPFSYVNVFTSHVNVGFFHGASLSDRARLLQGAGRFMRHVKLGPGRPRTPQL